jgi:phage gp16-like protein
MTLSVSKDQIRAIHALKSRARFDDDTYRDFLQRETGQRSSTCLTLTQAVRVIDRLKEITKSLPAPVRKPSKRPDMSGPYAAKLRALWISGWHLGVVRDRRDSALIAFVSRQTKIDHIRWLREPADAMKAIEALKAWLARTAGVVWGTEYDCPKRAVIAAQLRLLGRLTAGAPCPDFPISELDRLMTRLGEDVRRAPS